VAHVKLTVRAEGAEAAPPDGDEGDSPDAADEEGE